MFTILLEYDIFWTGILNFKDYQHDCFCRQEIHQFFTMKPHQPAHPFNNYWYCPLQVWGFRKLFLTLFTFRVLLSLKIWDFQVIFLVVQVLKLLLNFKVILCSYLILKKMNKRIWTYEGWTYPFVHFWKQNFHKMLHCLLKTESEYMTSMALC